MKTITLSILDSEEAAVMQQLHEWQRRQAVRFEQIDPLLFPGEPLTPAEWEEELRRSEASGSVTLTKAEALARFGL
jgi:hypothetical protein